MKFVSLVVAVIMMSFSASAQTTRDASKESAVAQVQQKKNGKAKSSKSKIGTAVNTDVITLRDEKSHKAKWTFEEMLKRRMEIDAEKGERVLRKE